MCIIVKRGHIASSDDEFDSVQGIQEIKYYFNLETEKRYEHVPSLPTTSQFCALLSDRVKKPLGSYLVFHLDELAEFTPSKNVSISFFLSLFYSYLSL